MGWLLGLETDRSVDEQYLLVFVQPTKRDGVSSTSSRVGSEIFEKGVFKRR
jgi:hypothetical protein